MRLGARAPMTCWSTSERGDAGIARDVVVTDGGGIVVCSGGMRPHCSNVALMVVIATSEATRR